VFIKVEDAFKRLFTMLNELYTQSFSMQVKYDVVRIFRSFFLQFFMVDDKELATKQGYERQKLQYIPMQGINTGDDINMYLAQCLEHITVTYPGKLNNFAETMNEKLLSQLSTL